MQTLAVAGQLVFHNLHFALEGPHHRPAVPQGKANRRCHKDGKGSENPEHELRQAVKLSIHILSKLSNGGGVGVDFCFYFGQSFDDLSIGEGKGCFDRPCFY